MKKIILPLFLISLSSWAQGYKSFFTSFDPSVNISKAELKEAIKKHMLKSGAYLALGETHLESDSVHQLQKEFVDVFLESTRGSDFTFCSEKIDTWFESEAGQILKNKASAFRQFPGSRFDKCEGPESRHYLNYAGAFHLFPYSRGFLFEFAKNPVIDRDDLNMLAQMKDGIGLFIPQFELVYLEARASSALINEELSVDDFRFKAKVHLEQSQKIRNSMVDVLAGDIYSGKLGVIIPKAGFASNVLMPKNEEFYYFLTNRSYRDMNYAHHFIQKLLLLDDSVLAKILELRKDKNGYFNTNYFTRTANGSTVITTFGDMNQEFDGESQSLSIGDLLIISQPNNKELECFLNEVQVDCFEALRMF